LDDHNRTQSWIRECSATHGHSDRHADRYPGAFDHNFIHPNDHPCADSNDNRYTAAKLDHDRLAHHDCDGRADIGPDRDTHGHTDRGRYSVAITNCDHFGNALSHRDAHCHCRYDTDRYADRDTRDHGDTHRNRHGGLDRHGHAAAGAPPE